MGKFFTALHIKSNSKDQFVKMFTQLMKKDGYVPCSEDEAALSYAAAFSDGGWVTLSNGNDSVGELTKLSAKIARDMKISCFTTEAVDSDFAILELHASSGRTSRIVVGDGEGYGVEKAPFSADDWKPLLQNGDIEQFLTVIGQDSTFVEADLVKIGGLLGISGFAMTADYDEFSESEGAFNLSFRKATEKKLTLNAAFKQVFGEVLEPLGYKLIKGTKYPYFVRVATDEIIHYVSVSKETADGRTENCIRYKCFNVYCGASTVYSGNIDFNENFVKFHSDFIDSVSDIYTNTYWRDLDMKYRGAIMEFYYDPTDNDSLITTLKRALVVTEEHALPAIEQLVTLEKCLEYSREMNHPLNSFFGGGEALLCTKLFSADEYVMFLDKISDREMEECRIKLNSKSNLSPKMKTALEGRIKCITEEREELRKKRYKIFTDPELQRKAPVELERRKGKNKEMLRSYGLDI